MRNRWDETEASAFSAALGECAYGSRLIGSEPDLVLHGGGNTSVKAPFLDITGREIEALYVKGSGWDLATIEPAGFTPLRTDRLAELIELEALSDAQMMTELSAARLDPAAPQPSVESLLHAFIPFPAVQHSHADVIVTLTNVANGEALVREVFGDDVVVVPYVMPGFDLARAVRRIWPEQSGDSKRGMVLLNHGLFTYGATTREAYDRHLDLITRAETWLKQRAPDSAASAPSLPDADPVTLAGLRREISQAAGKPMIVTQHRDQAVARFVRRPDLSALAGRGPLTPDHVIRTKRVPMVGRDVGRYVKEYRAYFESHRSRRQEALVMLDPAPRVVLDPEFGMLTAGATAADTAIAADIYRHTIPVLERAQDHLGGYQALGPAEMFDCEYWDLEQAKVRRSGPPPEFTGMVGLVTGAASGIGRACAAELMKRGAAVVGFDLSPQVASMFSGAGYLGLEVDVTDRDAQRHAVAQAVERFGGIDLVVIAAGIFGEPQKLSALDLETWSRVMSVNVDSVASLYRDLDPILRLSPVGGRVAVIATRNVPAPGRGAASYSASKAALTQLSRVAALEWAAAGIRLNLVHPDAVFDTAIWTEELLTQRAKEYGLTVEEYKRRNLLGVEVDSATVAAVVADLCSDRFRATTGAQIPIDGGNERVI